MKTLFNSKSLLFFLILFTSMFTIIGCSKEDKNTCSNFTSIGGEIKINGANYSMSIAQLIASSGNSKDHYLIQCGGFDSNCNKLISISLSAEIPSGSKLNGTYPIKLFDDVNTNEMSGDLTKQVISPISQSLEELKSGTAKFIDKGSKLYNIDITATTITGENVTFVGDVQF